MWAITLRPVASGTSGTARTACAMRVACAVRAACTARLTGKTGVEMEALIGVSVALLTIYDMCKAMDRSMELGEIHLVHKEGGKSGVYHRG